jgi:signal transduction histidine kinase
VEKNRESAARRLDARSLEGQRLSPETLPSTRVLRDGETVGGFEYLITDQAGCERVLSFNAVPLQIDGRRYGAVFAQEDITARYNYERALKDARDLADLYLDIMGHDISNMHQIMLMQLELAAQILKKEGRIVATQGKYIDIPLETLQRAARLIQNIRVMQKIKAGDIDLEIVDLAAILQDTLQAYSRIPGKDITIRASLEGRYPVHGNQFLKNVFSNLLDNAVKHCAGSVEIGLGLRDCECRGARYYCATVEDNGGGIPDELKAAVFQRLKRGKTGAKGTGLGLFIVKNLVEGYGGRIELHDRVPGDYSHGTMFEIYLPAAV